MVYFFINERITRTIMALINSMEINKKPHHFAHTEEDNFFVIKYACILNLASLTCEFRLERCLARASFSMIVLVRYLRQVAASSLCVWLFRNCLSRTNSTLENLMRLSCQKIRSENQMERSLLS